MRAHDVVIVGGGMIGLWTALMAAREGRTVTVLEATSLGRHASSASAGGVRSLNRHPAEIPLARRALGLWREAAADLGADVGFQGGGQLRVAEDEAGLELLHKRAALTAALGYSHEKMIGANALRAREEAIAPHVKGALVVEDDGFADPLKTMKALRGAVRSASIEVREGWRVECVSGRGPLTVHTANGAIEARTVVNAAGAWGNIIAQSVGEAVPMRAEGLQMSVTEALPPLVRAVIGISGKKLSLKQTPSGHIVIGGGFLGRLDADGTIARPQPRQVAHNLINAAGLFPALSRHRVVRSWAGIEGITQDGLPIVCESATTPGLVHAFGFCGHGFALAPLIARLVAGTIEGRAADLPLEPFSLMRFRTASQECVDA